MDSKKWDRVLIDWVMWSKVYINIYINLQCFKFILGKLLEIM